MKASELIEELKKAIAEHGDLPVLTRYWDDFGRPQLDPIESIDLDVEMEGEWCLVAK